MRLESFVMFSVVKVRAWHRTQRQAIQSLAAKTSRSPISNRFYGCSYMFHLSGNNRRDSHFMGS